MIKLITIINYHYMQFVGSKVYWKHSAAGKVINFMNTPFSIGEKRDLHCQFGTHYFGQKATRNLKQPTESQLNEKSESSALSSTTEQDMSKPEKKSRSKRSLQGTRKIGCHAAIHIREYILYPEYGSPPKHPPILTSNTFHIDLSD